LNPIELLDQYGLPIAILIPVGYFLWKQQHWIQNELIEDLEERFKRLEGIIIKLIDNAKKNEIKQEGIEKSYKSLVQIITKLLKEKKK
tara:strand:- start:1014 stop:1277 length:264 start_codon:yes stop_codon:yes gene_type:complete